MRFCTRAVVACWLVVTASGVARADFPPPIVSYGMIACLGCGWLAPLLAVLLVAFLPVKKKPEPPHEGRP